MFCILFFLSKHSSSCRMSCGPLENLLPIFGFMLLLLFIVFLMFWLYFHPPFFPLGILLPTNILGVPNILQCEHLRGSHLYFTLCLISISFSLANSIYSGKFPSKGISTSNLAYFIITLSFVHCLPLKGYPTCSLACLGNVAPSTLCPTQETEPKLAVKL